MSSWCESAPVMTDICWKIDDLRPAIAREKFILMGRLSDRRTMLNHGLQVGQHRSNQHGFYLQPGGCA